MLESLKRTNRMVVVEEGWPTCSISSEIIAICMTEGFDDLDAPVLRVTDVDVPLPYAANLEKLALIKAVGGGRGGEGGHAIAEPDARLATCDRRCHWPAELRPAFDALFAIDDAMARRRGARDRSRRLAAIKLAWWRERLEELDEGNGCRPSRAAGGAANCCPRGISGAELAGLEEGWLRLFDPFPWDAESTEALVIAGQALFGLGARLLGGDARIELAGCRATVRGRRIATRACHAAHQTRAVRRDFAAARSFSTALAAADGAGRARRPRLRRGGPLRAGGDAGPRRGHAAAPAAPGRFALELTAIAPFRTHALCRISF